MSEAAEDLAAYRDAGVDGDWLLADVDHEPPPVPDPAEASKVLGQLRREEVRLAETNAVADAEIASINAWRSDRIDGHRRRIEWMGGALEGFMRQHFAATGEKTVHTPHGNLSVSESTWQIEVTDEISLIDYARVHPELIRYGGPTTGDETTLVVRTDKASKTDLRKLDRGDTEATPDGRQAARVILVDKSGEMTPIPGVRWVRTIAPRFNVEGTKLETTNTAGPPEGATPQ